jgi:hypothetical protein
MPLTFNLFVMCRRCVSTIFELMLVVFHTEFPDENCNQPVIINQCTKIAKQRDYIEYTLHPII